VGRAFDSHTLTRIIAWSVSKCKSIQWNPKAELRLKGLKHSERLISRACGRVYASSFHGTVGKCEMPPRMDKVAVLKLAILVLVIVHKYPLPLILLSLHYLKLLQLASFLKIGRINVDVIQV